MGNWFPLNACKQTGFSSISISDLRFIKFCFLHVQQEQLEDENLAALKRSPGGRGEKEAAQQVFNQQRNETVRQFCYSLTEPGHGGSDLAASSLLFRYLSVWLYVFQPA